MRKKIRSLRGIGGCAVAALIAMGAIGGSLHAEQPVPTRIGACAVLPEETPVAPHWDAVVLTQCQGDCNEAWMGISQRYYNICYACGCLVDAAETPGELASANEQCRVERRRR